MRRIVFLFSILTLISLSLPPSFTTFTKLNVDFAASGAVFAQEELSIKEATVSADSKTTKSVEYTLPYPGILPDNPLYFLKMIRDRIVDFLISDPLKKAEFDLLQADKRLNTGIYLNNKNKDKNANLAQSTISKGENYFEDAIKRVREAKEQGMDTKDILRRLSESSKKRREILQSLANKAPRDLKDDYSHLLKRAKDFETQVTALMSK